MTARRSSATERRGIAVSWRRPTAILLAFSAATSVAAGVAGCASRQNSTGQLVGKTLPGNQDTAAAQQQLAAPPTTPPGQSTPYGHLSPPGNPKNNGHAPPPTTFPSSSWPTDKDAAAAMVPDLIGAAHPPGLRVTPEQNPADPKPILEIITMPMWLWVDAPAEQTTNTKTGNLVEAQVFIDAVQWSLDGTPSFMCGSTTQPSPPTPTTANAPNHGPGTPYVTSYDPANLTTPVTQACVYTVPNAPYYTTTTVNSTPTVLAGVHTWTAAVSWHVDFHTRPAADPNAAWSGWTNVQPMNAAPVVTGAPIQFRVGEIQALVTGP